MRCQCRPSVQRSSTAVRVREHVNAPVGVRRSGETFNFHLVSFPLIFQCAPNPHPLLLQTGLGCEVPALRENAGVNDGGGLILGPIWPCLASFTPSDVKAGNEATLASLGVRRRGITFIFRSFPLIPIALGQVGHAEPSSLTFSQGEKRPCTTEEWQEWRNF